MARGLRSFAATVTLCAFAATFVHARRARAQEDPGLDEARQHFQYGKSAYDQGDYATAVKEFKAAQALRPSPKLDYNIGKAFEHLGPAKARAALKYYNRYLAETDPDSPDPEMRKTRDEVRARIPVLQEQASAEAARQQQQGQEDAASQQPDQPDQPVVVEEVPPPQPHKKKTRWWIIPIVIVAVVGTIAVLVALNAASVSTNTTGATAGAASSDGPVLFRF